MTAHSARDRTVVARASNGQPRTFRLAANHAQRAAYRRLAVAILGLDVAHLATKLQHRQPAAQAA
jgi:hypothetical protein